MAVTTLSKAAKSMDQSAGRPAVRLLFDHLRSKQDEMVARLRELAELESPSTSKKAVDRLGRRLAEYFQHLGGEVRFHVCADYGDHLQVDFREGEGKPLLLLGHLDTVWEVGTLTDMPFRIADGRVWGPGTFDMKSGIVQAMAALEALRSTGNGLPRPVTVLLVTDEEVGSQSSRRITESLARDSAAVLVLEPANGPKGALKTARKGVGEFLVKVTGRAAHSGLDFGKGQSAILELAQQIGKIQQFTDLQRGITVNPGVIRGGTRANVVAAEAEVEVDARIQRREDAAYVEAKFRSLAPINPECKIEVTGKIGRPPLERTAGVAALFELAREIAAELEWKIEEASAGGGSDGNFTAALGIPTLDGLGAVGEGAHARNESVVIEEMPKRAALLGALIQRVR